MAAAAVAHREQAARFAESLLRGQPDRLAIARNAIGQTIREMVERWPLGRARP
jgi:hypothetical protein